jgi:hypothetical protein
MSWLDHGGRAGSRLRMRKVGALRSNPAMPVDALLEKADL